MQSLPRADPRRHRQTEDRKILRLATNDLDASAEEIADIYKQRWQIELFFKWIKQNLRIGHFLGRSQNAVQIQIYVALIAHILLRLAQATQTHRPPTLTFRRLISLNIMERRALKALRTSPEPHKTDHRQMTLPIVFS